MPLYQYEPDGDHCEKCETGFEVLQKMDDPVLTQCPDCGQPCHRIFSPFASVKSTRDTLSLKNLAAKGFTQYKKAGGGYYEKTCGDGPGLIEGGK